MEFHERQTILTIIRRLTRDALRKFGYQLAVTDDLNFDGGGKEERKFESSIILSERNRSSIDQSRLRFQRPSHPTNAKLAYASNPKYLHLTNPRLQKSGPPIPFLSDNSKELSVSRTFHSTTECRIAREDLSADRLIVLNQVYDAFIVCIIKGDERKRKVLLVDQHAADERLRADYLFHQLLTDGPEAASVELEPSQNMHLSEREHQLLERYHGYFTCWGISFDEEFKRVTHLPLLIAERCQQYPQRTRRLLVEHLEQLDSETSGFVGPSDGDGNRRSLGQCPKLLVEMIHSVACRGAIKFGDQLTVDKCRDLITKLSQSQFPFQCAHGRPSMIPILTLCNQL